MEFTLGQKFYMYYIKRPISILGALLGLILLSPIFIGTIILLFFVNKNGWKGVFFTQDRPGKNEKIFKALKFKTMTDEKDANGNLLPDADPRPLLVQYLPLYSEEQHHRHDVTPGMSGWAQVNGRNNISWTKKFELDVYYVRHIGFWMDMRVFFTTIRKVLMRADINTTTGQAATMDYFNGHN